MADNKPLLEARLEALEIFTAMAHKDFALRIAAIEELLARDGPPAGRLRSLLGEAARRRLEALRAKNGK